MSKPEERYVIKRAEIEAMEGRSKAHFLNAEAQRINKSLGDLTGLTGLGFHIIEVPPGSESTEMHVHHYQDECTYVLEGQGHVIIGDESIPIGPGDFIGYRARGKAHTMVNDGPDGAVLKCIVAGQRTPHEVGDYPRVGKRLYVHAGRPWEVVDVADVKPAGGDAGKK